MKKVKIKAAFTENPVRVSPWRKSSPGSILQCRH